MRLSWLLSVALLGCQLPSQSLPDLEKKGIGPHKTKNSEIGEATDLVVVYGYCRDFSWGGGTGMTALKEADPIDETPHYGRQLSRPVRNGEEAVFYCGSKLWGSVVETEAQIAQLRTIVKSYGLAWERRDKGPPENSCRRVPGGYQVQMTVLTNHLEWFGPRISRFRLSEWIEHAGQYLGLVKVRFFVSDLGQVETRSEKLLVMGPCLDLYTQTVAQPIPHCNEEQKPIEEPPPLAILQKLAPEFQTIERSNARPLTEDSYLTVNERLTLKLLSVTPRLLPPYRKLSLERKAREDYEKKDSAFRRRYAQKPSWKTLREWRNHRFRGEGIYYLRFRDSLEEPVERKVISLPQWQPPLAVISPLETTEWQERAWALWPDLMKTHGYKKR